ncbi:uncharacterized protein LOC123440467 isoform X3 [Hordeum vulgare subsp. vulgare]|uniref:uncharacterized protein LOC123440467 isoform X3 n=1 Tax=Hordeum vulgare subsp. vulgare TaxID=112509 RepID=UPI001D1A5926|nr:uncharacterized protein LOC123440467 isoform X3 [Hordeum vulgare subsp. vulgare]
MQSPEPPMPASLPSSPTPLSAFLLEQEVALIGHPSASLDLPEAQLLQLDLRLQETDPWRDQCSTVHGASPPWDEAATSPPSGGTICVVPNQQVPSTALLPGLPRPPLNTMAAASISPAVSKLLHD